MAAAITITTSASSPCSPCTHGLSGSSSGGTRKIWIVPTTNSRNVKPIHFQAFGQAPNAVRKTSASAPWMKRKPVKP